MAPRRNACAGSRPASRRLAGQLRYLQGPDALSLAASRALSAPAGSQRIQLIGQFLASLDRSQPVEIDLAVADRLAHPRRQAQAPVHQYRESVPLGLAGQRGQAAGGRFGEGDFDAGSTVLVVQDLGAGTSAWVRLGFSATSMALPCGSARSAERRGRRAGGGIDPEAVLRDRQRIAGAGGQQQRQAQRKECEFRAFHDEYCRKLGGRPSGRQRLC